MSCRPLVYWLVLNVVAVPGVVERDLFLHMKLLLLVDSCRVLWLLIESPFLDKNLVLLDVLPRSVGKIRDRGRIYTKATFLCRTLRLGMMLSLVVVVERLGVRSWSVIS